LQDNYDEFKEYGSEKILKAVDHICQINRKEVEAIKREEKKQVKPWMKRRY